MPLEIELKLRVPSQAAVERLFGDIRDQRSVRSELQPMPMISRYYDTPEQELIRRGWTLRLRIEGERPIAALKTRAEDTTGGLLFSRNEWQVPAENIREGIALLIEEGAPSELGEIFREIEPVEMCRLDLTRRGMVAEVSSGLLVDMTEDVGTLHAGDKSEPVHELEVELLFGRGEELEPLVEQLQNDYGFERERLSKYERALRLIRSRS